MEYYSILWIEKTETKDGIKKAYRKLAMEYHPDRNKGNKEAEEKFKQINEAYRVLWDDKQRQQYDMFGKAGAGWWNPFGWGFSGGVDVDLWDIFESFFWWGFSGGNRRTRSTEQKWEDLEYNLKIDLKTSIYGWKETISFKKRETCKSCNGEWWSGKKTCPKCGGSWQVTQTSQSIFGTIQQTVICDECSWSGEVFEHICEACRGEKRVVVTKELEIDIPAGIDEGMVIKMNEEWNDGINTKAKWDLYIRFQVEQQEKWLQRDGTDLHYKLEIEIVEAVLWTKKEVNIPILGKRTIEIKAGSENGTIIKIAGDGVKFIDRDKKWDLFIKLSIKIPKKLAKKERELYEQIAKERNIEVGNTSVLWKIFG